MQTICGLHHFTQRELAEAVSFLIRNPEAAKTMGSNGARILEQNRGSLERLLVLLEPLLDGTILR